MRRCWLGVLAALLTVGPSLAASGELRVETRASLYFSAASGTDEVTALLVADDCTRSTLTITVEHQGLRLFRRSLEIRAHCEDGRVSQSWARDIVNDAVSVRDIDTLACSPERPIGCSQGPALPRLQRRDAPALCFTTDGIESRACIAYDPEESRVVEVFSYSE